MCPRPLTAPPLSLTPSHNGLGEIASGVSELRTLSRALEARTCLYWLLRASKGWRIRKSVQNGTSAAFVSWTLHSSVVELFQERYSGSYHVIIRAEMMRSFSVLCYVYLFICQTLAQDILTVLNQQKNVSLFTQLLQQYDDLVQTLNSGDYTCTSTVLNQRISTNPLFSARTK